MFPLGSSSRIYLEDFDMFVVIDQHANNRTLSVVTPNGAHADVDVIAEWGPKLRTNLYKNEEGGLSVVDFDGTWTVRRNPLRFEKSWSSDGWQYLGTLMLSGYRTADEEPECMDILMEDEGWDNGDSVRLNAYKTSC